MAFTLILSIDKVIVWQKMESFHTTVCTVVMDVFYQFPPNTGNCHNRGQLDRLWAVRVLPLQQSCVGQVVAECQLTQEYSMAIDGIPMISKLLFRRITLQ